ncbi:hypothetical protein [Sphingobacterium humi]|uniref:Uncharacterized protein n=1 Tax=Sphingobacterium humi TaxID=1796905 RepID=A0A6N8L3A5_9SPHI|nr:hypothetical protein [Sphingobacterium humi]MVZ63757.1 hypothetical protein [Sphingobacterium humi]
MSGTKPPLSPGGIDTKLTELYALSDIELEAEAVQIRDDFSDWLDDNFTLTLTQQNYISGMSARYAAFLADCAYITVKNRLPVDYTPPANPGISKRLDIRVKANGLYDPTDPSTPISGSLDIEADNI